MEIIIPATDLYATRKVSFNVNVCNYSINITLLSESSSVDQAPALQ